MSLSYSSLHLTPTSIRVLTLQPSPTPSTTPTCTLTPIDLDCSPGSPLQPFTALSYAWGDPKTQATILVNGASLSITSALSSALVHLRLPDRERRLWIDQICINQADEDEKASQVRLMRRVYSEAEDVVAWLGEDGEGSDGVMGSMRVAGGEASKAGLRDVPRDEYASLRWHVTRAFGELEWRRREDVAGVFEDGDTLAEKKRAVCGLVEKYSRQWDQMLDQIYALFARPYFRRGWIKQEVVIPKRLVLQCGHQTVGGDEFVAFVRLDSFIQEARRQRWTALVRALQERGKGAVGTTGDLCMLARAERLNLAVSKAQVINTEKFNQRFGLGQTVGIRSRFHMGGYLQQEMTLVFMIKTFVSDLQFTDPRDRVFGLLGMASDTDSLQIQVDYTLSWEEVYADAIKRIIQAGDGNVDILFDIYSPSETRSPRLPSWAPDLNTAKTGLIKKYTFLSSQPFSAGGVLTPDKRIPDDQQFSPSAPSSVLLLRGVIVDTIDSVGSLWTPDATTGSYFSKNLSSLKSVLSTLQTFYELSVNPSRLTDPGAHPSSSHTPILPRPNHTSLAPLRTAILDHESIDPSSGGRRRRATAERMLRAVEDLYGGVPQVHVPELQDYINQAQILQEMVPFLGEKGYLGLGPKDTQEGDVVVVFWGASVPFILRPMEMKGRRRYRLVGEAYCDGVMDGEVGGMGLEEVVFQLV